jgi:phenylpyruvate tautomerase PptA (4-oxalocrotonate tautomerase family)
MTMAQSTMVLGLGMKAMVVHRVLEMLMLLVTKVPSVTVSRIREMTNLNYFAESDAHVSGEETISELREDKVHPALVEILLKISGATSCFVTMKLYEGANTEDTRIFRQVYTSQRIILGLKG